MIAQNPSGIVSGNDIDTVVPVAQQSSVAEQLVILRLS